MKRVRWFVIAGLLMVPLSGGQQALALDEEFRATGSVRLEGVNLLNWTATGATHTPTEGDPVLVVSVDAAHLRLFEVPEAYVVERALGGERRFGGASPQSLPVWEGDASGDILVTLHAREQGAVRLLPVDGSLTFQSNASRVDIGPLGARGFDAYGSVFTHVAQTGGRSLRPDFPHTLSTVAGDPSAVAGAFLAVVGADVLLPDGTVLDVPGRRLDQDLSHQDPVTGSEEQVYENHVLFIDARSLSVSTPGPWAVAATAVDGRLQGSAEWRGLTGHVLVAGDGARDPNVLGINGTLHLGAGLVPPDGQWALRGSAQRLSIDFQPRFALEAGDVVRGLTLLGALGALLPLVREVLAVAVGRLSDPLVSRTRQGILGAVHSSQPITLQELQEATGHARGTLRYHLRVLESARVVQRIRHGGRGATYALNGGSLMFTAESLSGDERDGGVVVGEALSAAASHPVRRALYHHIVQNGRVDQSDLAARIARERSVAPSTLSYHLGVLSDAGLIRSEWSGGRKLYCARFSPQAARSHQYRTYLGRPLWRDIVRCVGRRGNVPLDDLRAWLLGRGHDADGADEAVSSLQRLSLLHVHDGVVTLNRAVAQAIGPRSPT